MNVAILAHEKFPDRAKTALGVLRYADHDAVAVLDWDNAGQRVNDFVPDVQDAPIHEGMADLEADEVDTLLIGIAPIGGGFVESWREDVRTALEYGCDVVSGLHYFLSEDEEFVRLADEHDCELRDVRKPPEDLTVAQGIAGEVDAEIILTVGTDCSVGKMTTTMELARDAREAGHDVGVIPTGQTGIMIEGWGNPIDRVVSDFTAGAVEEMILEKAAEHDYLFVEGQGSIVHPAYSAVTCGILHGAMADKLVLCHVAGREEIHGYESFDIPELSTYVDLYEGLSAPVADGEVVAGALNTTTLEDDAAAQEAVEAYTDELGVPATDVIRFGTDDVLEALF
ncbi:Uncharacterized conserved protein, NAD-dependent epimerase/dehydratase family [Natronorubrum sediminis]|uniref:Uncharacterized conserved protein, NAD-dependent epimerase/dehydratase family n=1 Tax=Natronorubrum sediminis TaxID=640943 RepID=A0A1H6G0H4_9EURY|nr:DUF1611 domain-containing protein [Natronorubrum sediminis]SEH16586.1 Uncharacterized conserved protein, NAD-dependent epimerase/dehydratase family [Natronorubrum sediminis]